MLRFSHRFIESTHRHKRIDSHDNFVGDEESHSSCSTIGHLLWLYYKTDFPPPPPSCVSFRASSVVCVQTPLGIHTLSSCIIIIYFTPSRAELPSDGYIMLPPLSTVFTCEPRTTRQFPVSVYFFCLPAPFFSSLSSFEYTLCFFLQTPRPFSNERKKKQTLGRSFLCSRYADWSRRTSVVDPSNFSTYNVERENLQLKVFIFLLPGGKLFTKFVFPRRRFLKWPTMGHPLLLVS